MTRFPACALRSVELDTPDLAKSEDFYTRVWGLTVCERMSDAIYLRASGSDHHVLVLRAGPQSALRCVVFRASTAQDMASVAARARDAGCVIEANPPSDPAGGATLAFREPNGMMIRLVHGDARHADGQPVANLPERLSHVNVNSRDVDTTAAFFTNVLGFKLVDRSKLMAFVRCNSDHHAVVIAEAQVNTLNHVAFQLPDLESVMRGSGRLIDHGFPIAWGVGRHGPGDNVFAYFIDPLGVVIEYTSEVLQVDDSYRFRGPDEWVWPKGRTDHWGIAPPKAEHVKQAQLAVPFA